MALARLHELNGRGIPWLNAQFNDVNGTVPLLFPFNYNRHVAWASHADREVVRGYTPTSFNPGGNVLRAEAAAMFYRYAVYLARNCATAERLNTEIKTYINNAGGNRAFLTAQGFVDTSLEHLPEWAEVYMAWVVRAGIIDGRNDLLDARYNITRAEGAAMFARFRRIFLRGTFILDQSESENQTSTVFSGTNPNTLTALLARRDVVLQTPGNLGIFAHHSPFVIPEGRTLTVVNTLNVQAGAELIVNGTLVVQENGRINNHGNTGGTVRIASSGILVNNGSVENVSNSTVINYGTIENNGRFEVRAYTRLHNPGITSGTTPLSIHRNAITVVPVSCEIAEYMLEFESIYEIEVEYNPELDSPQED